MSRRRLSAVTVGMLAVAATVVGLVGSSVASSSAAATPAWLQKVEATVAKGYKGQDMAVPKTGPKAVKGKKVWNIVCTLSIPDCSTVNQGVNAAGKALGWNVTTVDNMSNPVTAGQQIMSAIAAKANGIVVTGIDCAAIQNALTAANAAGVKSIDLGGEQCSPPLYTAQARIGGLPYEQGTTNVYDLNRIDWGIDQTHGNMKLIIVNISDFSAVSLQTAAILKDLKVCPTCSVLDTVNLSIANLPALAQLLPAALNQYPQANAIWLYDGSALELGAQAAIENAGRATGAKRLVVIAGTCAYGEPALIRAGWDIGCDAFSNQWDGWQSMDFLNRLFAGETPAKLPTVGTGLQIIDATHNLPKGSAWVPPLNFEAGYEKVWSGK